MHNLFSTENIDKAVLTLSLAWFVYIVLLWGITMKAGGVGGFSCGFNVAGAGIPDALAYFGSRILQQFVAKLLKEFPTGTHLHHHADYHINHHGGHLGLFSGSETGMMTLNRYTVYAIWRSKVIARQNG